MSIASRITSIEEHIGDVYDTLELGGSDLTNVNKNIVNINSELKNRLKDYLANGIEVVWDNWNKVNGEGTSLTLNNTLEAKMKIELKGNTQQTETPTPESPQDIHVVSGDNSIEVVGKNFVNDDFTTGYQLTNAGITYANPDWTANFNFFKVKPNTQYTYVMINTTARQQLSLCEYSTDNANSFIKRNQEYSQTNYITITTSQTTKYVRVAYNNNYGNNKTMLVKGTTIPTTYEQYQSASYPISLGYENLLQNNAVTGTLNGITYTKNDDGSITLNGTATSDSYLNIFTSTTQSVVKDNAKTYTYSIGVSNSNIGLAIYEYTNTWNAIKYAYVESTTYKPSGTQNGQMFRLIVKNGATLNNVKAYPQLEEGSTAHTYTPYGKAIELCKIGTYQDKIDKSTGINKLAPTQSFNETINSVKFTGDNGVYTINGTASANTRPTYKNITPYTIQSGDYLHIMNNWSGNAYIFLKIGNTDYSPSLSTTNRIMDLSSYVGQTITQISFQVQSGTSINAVITPMILNTNTATEYEPYGTGWYLKKEIGKVVLNGSETWSTWGVNYTTQGITGFYSYNFNDYDYNNRNSIMSNYFANNGSAYGGGGVGINASSSGTKYVIIGIENTQLSDTSTSANAVNSFKTWLGTNNTTIYYVLSTPTYETITDTTLLGQLEKLSNVKSYNQQTNISQNNNDNASIMNASALQNM